MKHTILLLCVAGTVMPAMAQFSNAGTETEKDKSSCSTLELVKTSTNADVKELLKKDRPQETNAIPVPHFAIRTKDNAFVMSIGGQINTILGADLGNDLYQMTGAGGGFVTSQIPVPYQPGKRSDFFINPLNANVDMQIVGLGGTEDQITGYMKFGTNGINNQMLLKKAYVSWRGFTLGQKNTLFQDNNACQPPTIDPEGPDGMISTTVYEVSYVSPSYSGFRYALGIDFPSYYTSNGIYRGKDYKIWHGVDIAGKPVADPNYYNQNVPDVPLWIEYSASSMNRIRLSGIIRNFTYRNLLTDKRENTVGWGMMLSGNLNPVEPLIFYATAAYGKGIGAYLQDIAGMPLSYVPKDSEPGLMTPTPMMGLMFGATYNINSQWQVNAMASEARLWDVSSYASTAATSPGNINDYKYGFYAAGNVFYNVSSYLQVGLEYLYGQRATWSNGKGSDNRVQMQLMFTI